MGSPRFPRTRLFRPPDSGPRRLWSLAAALGTAALILLQGAGRDPAAGALQAEESAAGSPDREGAEAVRSRVLASVVGIRVSLPQPRIIFSGKRKIKAEVGPTEGRGSGVIVDSSGVVLTCAHVVGSATTAHVFLAEDLEVEGRVLVSDRTSDLALVKIPVEGLTAVNLALRPTLLHGQLVHLASRPGGGVSHFTDASLSAPGAYHVGHSHLEFFRQFLGAIEPGDSGGMLVDENGTFVGLLSVGSHEGRLGYAIARELVIVALARLRAGPPVIWPWLGLGVESPLSSTEGDTSASEPRSGEGARIWTVAPGSPGEAAGLRPGDVIVSLDGRPVEHFLSAMLTVASRPVGARFRIGIMPKGSSGSPEEARVVALLSAARPLDPVVPPLDLFERMTGIRLEPGGSGPGGAAGGLFVRRAPPPNAQEHRSYVVGSRIVGVLSGLSIVRTLEEGRTDQETPVWTIEDLGEALRDSNLGDRVTALVYWVKDGKTDTMLLTGEAKKHPFL